MLSQVSTSITLPWKLSPGTFAGASHLVDGLVDLPRGLRVVRDVVAGAARGAPELLGKECLHLRVLGEDGLLLLSRDVTEERDRWWGGPGLPPVPRARRFDQDGVATTEPGLAGRVLRVPLSRCVPTPDHGLVGYEAVNSLRVGYRDQVDALGQPKERGDTTVEWTRPAERDGVQA